MFKKLVSEVYERVVKSYKSTLAGFGLAVAVVVVEQVGVHLGTVEAGWAAPVATVLVFVGAALKRKQADYPAPPAQPSV